MQSMSNMEPKNLRIYRFHPNGLDPVSVYIEQFSPVSSRMTVQCYSRAWTAYWGSHGDKHVESFIVGCSPDYIADNLIWGLNGLMTEKNERHEYDYIIRIVRSIQEEFRKTGGES